MKLMCNWPAHEPGQWLSEWVSEPNIIQRNATARATPADEVAAAAAWMGAGGGSPAKGAEKYNQTSRRSRTSPREFFYNNNKGCWEVVAK